MYNRFNRNTHIFPWGAFVKMRMNLRFEIFVAVLMKFQVDRDKTQHGLVNSYSRFARNFI
jgi:hypothetical protein